MKQMNSEELKTYEKFCIVLVLCGCVWLFSLPEFRADWQRFDIVSFSKQIQDIALKTLHPVKSQGK